MACEEMKEILSAYIDRRADPEEQRLVESHLAGCRRCEADLRWLRAMKSAAAGVPALAMPNDLKASLLKQARQFSRKPRVWSWPRLPALGVGAAAFAAAALGIVFHEPSTGGDEIVTLEEMVAAHHEYEATKMVDALGREKP